jgi:signal transduction histidine kinase
LRLAEIDAGMRRSGFVSLDVSDLAANAVEFYEPAAELKDIDLKMRSNGPLLVSADPVLLAQALSNLIDNALKYAPQRGSIEVAVQKLDDLRAEISVSDNGPGIDDEEKTKVMQRFYRGDASRGTPGVGLGLSLVQAVAKLHGSTLELRDNGPGLRVVMTVPIEPSGASLREVQPPASPASEVVAPPTLASLP